MKNFIKNKEKYKNNIEKTYFKIIDWYMWEKNHRITPTPVIVNNIDYSKAISVEDSSYRNIGINYRVIVSHREFIPENHEDYIFGFIINNSEEIFTNYGIIEDYNKIERLVYARKVPKRHKEKYGLDFDYEFLVSPRRKIVQLPITPAWKNKRTGKVIVDSSFVFSAPPIHNIPTKNNGK